MAVANLNDESRKVRDPHLRALRVWSDAEKSALRANYATVGAKGLLNLLPTRSFSSIVGMAKKLKIASRHWSDAERATLKKFFATESMDALAARLGRSVNAVMKEAQLLGHSHADMIQGTQTIAEACRVYGYSWSEMRRLLRFSKVNGERILFDPVKASKSKHGVRKYYAVLAVEQAVERWRNTETPGAASVRLGVASGTLRQWLREAGVKGDPNAMRSGRTRLEWRIPRAVLDRVVVDRVRSDNLVTAAERHGIDRFTIGKLLTDAGIKRQAGVWVVSPDRMDRICEAYWRKRSVWLERVAKTKSRIHDRVVRADARSHATDARMDRELWALRVRLRKMESAFADRAPGVHERRERIARRAEEAAAAWREVEAARAHVPSDGLAAK